MPACRLDDFKDHLRLTSEGEYNDSEESYLNMLLLTATERITQYLNSALITSVYERQYVLSERYTHTLAVELRKQPSFILTFAPVQEVLEVKIYRGNVFEEIDFAVDLISKPPVLIPAKTVYVGERLYVKYIAGHGEAADAVPAPVQMAVMMLASFLYKNRGDCPAKEALELSGAKEMLQGYKNPAG